MKKINKNELANLEELNQARKIEIAFESFGKDLLKIIRISNSMGFKITKINAKGRLEASLQPKRILGIDLEI